MEQGLGSRAHLDKVDKLRELGISHLVPLPQMVVVGDQSAGKSSVLESLTGIQFPRAVTLCTRHATEIICRREPTESVVVSIIPYNATPEHEALVRNFRRSTSTLSSDEFPKIFEDAAKVMGIKASVDDGGGSAFSLDVLRVEISGPEADHLTVIDVPGMFETVTPGLTTEADIDLVKNMVKRFIEESRTIILAVVPCTGDIANQKILRFAAEADPEGKRTLGVLTKPDLAVENATKAVICDLIKGKRRDLHLGYCVVKNRGADDMSSSMETRNRQEQELFSQAPWNILPPDRIGIPALRNRIQKLLMDRTRAEFPSVRQEVMSNLKKNQQLLADMGESRSTTDQQRAYIGKIASRFTQIKNYGLDAYYTRHKIFDDLDLRLITRMRSINEAFSEIMHQKGHTREFYIGNAGGELDEGEDSDEDCEEESYSETSDTKLSASSLRSIMEREVLYDEKIDFEIPLTGEEELDDILSGSYCCPSPKKSGMMLHIEEQYLTARGYELGTFSSEMLPCTFKEQAKKWQSIARAHVSNATLIVHHFIHAILEECCPDEMIRDELWAFLLENLQKRYRRAMEHVEFLISVEFRGKSITYDPRFDEALSKTKLVRDESVKREAVSSARENEDNSGFSIIKLVDGLFRRESALECTRRDIHDVLRTYYEVVRGRFVDVVCQQVVDHFLLHAADGPLAVLSDQVVFDMTPEQLEAIAGEDMVVREKRERLAWEIDSYKKAMKILRG